MMMSAGPSEASYWDQAATRVAGRPGFDSLLAEQYRNVHLGLIARWAKINPGMIILKTDLFAEAVHPSRSFLWSMLKLGVQVVGIDISAEVVSRAKARQVECAQNLPLQCVNCDVRQLPFASDTFDLIISDSTLDHFHNESEIVVALSELKRVLKPGGILIITMDNRGNVTEPLFRAWLSLRLHPVFIGKTYSVAELKKALSVTGFTVVQTTAIIHNPRFFVRRLVPLVRKIAPVRFDGAIRGCLAFFDSLEHRRTRYLTGQFIAAKAVKPL